MYGKILETIAMAKMEGTSTVSRDIVDYELYCDTCGVFKFSKAKPNKDIWEDVFFHVYETGHTTTARCNVLVSNKIIGTDKIIYEMDILEMSWQGWDDPAEYVPMNVYECFSKAFSLEDVFKKNQKDNKERFRKHMETLYGNDNTENEV